MRIKLDNKHQALARGIKAGAAALQQVNAAGADKDYETRLSFFWLAVGMAMAQEEDLDLSDLELQELYVTGASSNKPAKRQALPEAAFDSGLQMVCGREDCRANITTLKEEGYSRSWSFSWDPSTERATATSHGFQDYSDEGDGDHVLLCTRGHANELPIDDWEWA